MIRPSDTSRHNDVPLDRIQIRATGDDLIAMYKALHTPIRVLLHVYNDWYKSHFPELHRQIRLDATQFCGFDPVLASASLLLLALQ